MSWGDDWSGGDLGIATCGYLLIGMEPRALGSTRVFKVCTIQMGREGVIQPVRSFPIDAVVRICGGKMAGKYQLDGGWANRMLRDPV